jgi:hypothetical protein
MKNQMNRTLTILADGEPVTRIWNHIFDDLYQSFQPEFFFPPILQPASPQEIISP